MTASVRLEGDGPAVECSPREGFLIRAIIDPVTGANALWRRDGFRAADFSRALGPSGDLSIESFTDLFQGGWFEMFPTTGYPGTARGAVGVTRSLLHGEVMRLPWEVTYQDASCVEASVVTVRTPLELTRRVEIRGGGVVVSERARNLAPMAVPFVWGHHPCFDRATFAGGRLEIDVERAEVPAPVFDEANNTLASGASFEFPKAPTTSGGIRDVAAIPDVADGRHEQCALVVRKGGVRVTAPNIGRAFSLVWSKQDFPYVLLWQDYRAEGMAFWGTCDTFAVEPSSSPGRSLDDAVASQTVRMLGPDGEAVVEMHARWDALS